MIWRLTAIFLIAVTCYAQSYSVNGDPQLELYAKEALERNPAVSEAFARYRSSLQKLPQARSLPDPMLGATQARITSPRSIHPTTFYWKLSILYGSHFVY